MADRISYIYIFTLSIGGKAVAKYAGQHSFIPEGTETFDVNYLGSGTCWRKLRTQFGFSDGCKWMKSKDSNAEYEFVGKDKNIVFTGRIACMLTDCKDTNKMEKMLVEAMVQSEGLNMDLINAFREETAEYRDTEKFLKEHKNICGGKGLFVNQVPGGSNFAQSLTEGERRYRTKRSILQFMLPEYKIKFVNGQLGMLDKAVFRYKDGREKEHKLTHVYGTAGVRLGYSFEELKSKMSEEEAAKYDDSQKLLLIQKYAREIAKKAKGNGGKNAPARKQVQEILAGYTSEWDYAYAREHIKALSKEIINSFAK